MLQITLLKDPFFFIPGKLHLTDEAPGPIDLDPNLLSTQEKEWLIKAVQSGRLSIKKDGLPLSLNKPKVAVITVSKKDEADSILKKAEEARELLKKNTAILLDGAPTSVIKRIENTKDLSLLKEAISIEKRPKVLQTLKNKVDKLTEEISKIVGTGVSDKDLAFKDTGLSYDVTEEVD